MDLYRIHIKSNCFTQIETKLHYGVGNVAPKCQHQIFIQSVSKILILYFWVYLCLFQNIFVETFNYPPTNGGQQRLGMLVAFVRPSVTFIWDN